MQNTDTITDVLIFLIKIMLSNKRNVFTIIKEPKWIENISSKEQGTASLSP